MQTRLKFLLTLSLSHFFSALIFLSLFCYDVTFFKLYRPNVINVISCTTAQAFFSVQDSVVSGHSTKGNFQFLIFISHVKRLFPGSSSLIEPVKFLCQLQVCLLLQNQDMSFRLLISDYRFVSSNLIVTNYHCFMQKNTQYVDCSTRFGKTFFYFVLFTCILTTLILFTSSFFLFLPDKFRNCAFNVNLRSLDNRK